MKLVDFSAYYGTLEVLKNINLSIEEKKITVFMGPSGCGKSTLVRTLNRMNDDVPGFRTTGKVLLDGEDIYAPEVDPVLLKTRVGMVFQKPNPFPISIYDNVAFGPRIHKLTKSKEELDSIVEESLQKAALWDEVKDRLGKSAWGLSGGQQQRLCIARALAVQARGAPHGRARIRARPGFDVEGRGAHGRAEGELHRRPGHPQHAAGGEGRDATSPSSTRATSWSSAPRRTSSRTRRARSPRSTSEEYSSK